MASSHLGFRIYSFHSSHRVLTFVGFVWNVQYKKLYWLLIWGLSPSSTISHKQLRPTLHWGCGQTKQLTKLHFCQLVTSLHESCPSYWWTKSWLIAALALQWCNKLPNNITTVETLKIFDCSLGKKTQYVVQSWAYDSIKFYCLTFYLSAFQFCLF